jgi:hypothetical protein
MFALFKDDERGSAPVEIDLRLVFARHPQGVGAAIEREKMQDETRLVLLIQITRFHAARDAFCGDEACAFVDNKLLRFIRARVNHRQHVSRAIVHRE